MRWLIVALAGALLVACTESAPPVTAARDIAERYYRLIENDRPDEAVKLFAAEDRGRWLDFLQRWRDELGALQKINIHTVETNTTFSGTLYLFIAETEYTGGEASEIVTIRAAVNKEGLKIVSHEIDPY